MKVEREVVAADIEQLRVVDPNGSDYHEGQAVGYRCQECQQADETLDQLWHADDCPLAGEHGRSHYDELEPTTVEGHSPELSPDHEIVMVRSAETDNSVGVSRGDVILFICAECGNADEDLFEIVHDEACSLAECGPA